MNTRKNLLLGLFALTVIPASRPLAAQEAKPLDASALKVLDAKPTAPEGKTRSKLVEKSREYSKRGVRIITYADNSTRERSLVEIPLLFEVNSDRLKGAQSHDNLRLLAEKLKSLAADGIEVSIEGHASAEGAAERNLELSKQRAEAIQFRLRELGVKHALIKSAEGYGSAYAAHPASAPEEDRELDRRVLVVREK
jgi:outer membrane protein OmpA-like peptidoglycan-associated protein